MTIKPFFLIVSVTLIVAQSSIACGPWIPTPYVVRNDRVFFDAPLLTFTYELKEQLDKSAPHSAVLTQDAPNASLELIKSLQQAGVSEAEQQSILNKYQAYRSLLNEIKKDHDAPADSTYRSAKDEEKLQRAYAALQDQLAPDDLPLEFQLYLNGALAYNLDDANSAQQYWNELLALPPEKRPVQTVPAAYMLARLSQKTEAPQRYQRVRQLVDSGFVDIHGLAAASYGWEAQAQLLQKHYAEAVSLYILQWKAGYENAAASLRIVAREIWQSSDELQLAELVQNDQVRAVLTADLICRYDATNTQNLRQRLLNMLPSPQLLTVSEAGRFALMEYQQNNLSAAKLWLDYADPKDALALWIRSKILLRDGHIDEGRTLLVALLADTNESQPDWSRIDTRHAWGELGLLMLNKGAYLEAADCFVNADSWLDLAYVLERVLTTDELITWARNAPPQNENMAYPFCEPQSLIARRLMREEHFNKALEYFPPLIRIQAESYMNAMQQASDPALAPHLRAKKYWMAARLTRDYGLELFATELMPDYAWSSGSFDRPNVVEMRHTKIQHRDSEEEIKRIEASATLPDQRFHYRYRAALLAELAAGLLPNNDENAARIYCIAGGWLKHRDPYAADRFYKHLVVRCPETTLGQDATQRHWFPPAEFVTKQPFEG
ncbi:hypothetical protein [Cerasicoccus arenae]|uniref:Tetratricopeptide repeat protein n=1 Tax=Cerasicoccus arenae TaxID=424488 RepID=A0A8J3DF89_9BACT|nr:hypothetical protein [Cerasicoccus arenae]MBK1859780.1 hypothetical protein [Cerasicoccus arenae]GHC13119.1 hypothetical protein GCM10007047_33020 [Cerasicoccus arenae]